MEQPNVIIVEGYDSIKSEDGETGFGVYDPESRQIFIAGAVPDEIFVKALLHELMHWVQDISGYAFNEGEANTFAENIYNTMESYIVTNRWIPCSERMPVSDGIYIVDDYRYGKHWIHTVGYMKRSNSWCEQHGIYYDDKYGRYDKQEDIIAWMPLPEPYKERREE